MALTESLTLQDWPLVARAAGIDPAPYAVARKWIKDEKGRAQVTLALTAPGAPGLIAKQVFEPGDEPHFTALVTAQTRAAAALVGHPTARVPRLIAHDLQRRLMLTELVPGETALAALEGAADHGAILARCGAWAAAFHAASEVEERRFQPRYMADHLSRIAAEVTSAKRSVPARGQFLAMVAAIRDRAARAEGAPTVSAIRHGDLQARNLILDGALTWGIDLGAIQSAPVGYDIARFLLDHAWTSADLDRLEPGELLPADAIVAFFDGYRLTSAADESVRFLMAVRLALDWASLPPDPDRMSVRRLIQFRRMQRIAAHAFG